MNSKKRFKNLISILMLYAANLIVRDNVVIPAGFTAADKTPRLTGRVFPKLTGSMDS